MSRDANTSSILFVTEVSSRVLPGRSVPGTKDQQLKLRLEASCEAT